MARPWMRPDVMDWHIEISPSAAVIWLATTEEAPNTTSAARSVRRRPRRSASTPAGIMKPARASVQAADIHCSWSVVAPSLADGVGRAVTRIVAIVSSTEAPREPRGVAAGEEPAGPEVQPVGQDHAAMPAPAVSVQWSTASAVAPTSAAASAALTTWAVRGSRSNGAIDAPATSHVVQITMIIAVSTAIFAAASVVAASARWALAKTAAIAIQAFGLATPRSAPPAGEKVSEAAAGSESGAAVAM